MRLATPRLVLRSWTDDDRSSFAEMNADPVVMRDLGGPLGRAESDRKLDRYATTIERNGYGRWLVERSGSDGDPVFVGYAGVMPVAADHPLGRHDEIGWRLCRSAWGHGFATEAARAALDDAFTRVGLSEVVSYTAPDNLRSQAVMNRLGLARAESLDFTAHYDGVGEWRGLVWRATQRE